MDHGFTWYRRRWHFFSFFLGERTSGILFRNGGISSPWCFKMTILVFFLVWTIYNWAPSTVFRLFLGRLSQGRLTRITNCWGGKLFSFKDVHLTEERKFPENNFSFDRSDNRTHSQKQNMLKPMGGEWLSSSMWQSLVLHSPKAQLQTASQEKKQPKACSRETSTWNTDHSLNPTEFDKK